MSKAKTLEVGLAGAAALLMLSACVSPDEVASLDRRVSTLESQVTAARQSRASAAVAGAAMRDQLSAQVLEGCSSELAQYCADVTPGEARLLACLYAHGDELSGQCDYALYDAAARLEQAVGAVTYVATECRSELETYCANVEVGEGRVAQCLKDHTSELSPGCDQALITVGMK
jgi:Cysteine rich repeat